jgi:hypothetical protein
MGRGLWAANAQQRPQSTNKIHDYLGMPLDYSTARSVKIGITECVNKVLGNAPSSMDGTATTPADKNLFEVHDGVSALNTNDAEFLHAMVATLLFLCK